MTCTSKLQNNIINALPILDNPTKVISYMLRTLLVLELLKYLIPDGGHLGFVQMVATEGPVLALSRNWQSMVISRPGPKLVLVERCEQSWCFSRLSPLTISKIY